LVVPPQSNDSLSNHYEFGAYGASMAVDTSTGDVWLFGGNNILINLDFITRLTPTTFTYTQTVLNQNVQPPNARYGSVFGFYQSSSTKTLWVWGGTYGQGAPGSITQQYYTDHGKFDIGSQSWLTITQPSGSPSARAYSAVVTLKSGQFLIVFGGSTGSGSSFAVLNDVYKFDMSAAAWSTLSPSGTAPPKRDRHAGMGMQWTGEDSCLFFGGADVNATPLNDFWYLVLTTNNSSPIQPPPPGVTSSSGGVVLPSLKPTTNSSEASVSATPTPTPIPIITDSSADKLLSWMKFLF